MTRGRMPNALLADMFGRLAVATGAGIDLRRAWRSESARVPARWRPTMDAVARALEAGASLGDALSAAGPAFPPLVRGLLTVGAETGHEPEMCRELAGFLKRAARNARPLRAIFAGLPGIAARQCADLATWSRVMSIALGTGMDVGRAVGMAAMVVPALAVDADAVRGLLRSGLSLSDVLRRTQRFPASVVEAVAVGEATGTVPERLDRLADFLDDEATRRFRVAARSAAWTCWAAFAAVVIVIVFRVFTGYLAILQDAGRPL